MSLKERVIKRCVEITDKFDKQQKEYEDNVKKEYAKGEEYGLIYEQHNDATYQIRKDRNTELIHLESDIKSTLEKELKEMESIPKKKKKKESFIIHAINYIVEKNQLDMSDYEFEKSIIKKMIDNRNHSEHETDNLLREIDTDYIKKCLNATCDYVEVLIEKLYDKKALK